ncbi:2-oxoglutarate dehydrogenase complex dihydrolipoyllysine-residue succinyltransferase [Frateuria aurantia]|uniref:Dihydrolipoyllysine-residue succinyltransferase component of 2-oxoglutarate dehydrogenase complex n=1 Tax=Frateuria aurantia (strain ATCC 33424 / DSM 6220 / KCTC 2777 / LMG 1558 / NBRC 3245 / NCIMB 13370) TaxID=767434 RepID=H8KY92_FRAAD|nr:2-oxoglutarate dehydrogenase complex dihydrolipoyllysine-residue succinyltransferase [Frateuria aurantia]AFC86086.1 2-oxoglutarate dehydrogenase complex dihydrolipoamide succinyltransferase [Frateuria aurantia DSM 6220]
MSIEVKVPVLPESVSDATIATWHKQVGEAVKRDENLVDLETDKVVLEVPATADGVLKEILFKEGDTVNSQQVIAIFEEGAVAAAATAAAPAEAEARTAAAAPAAAGKLDELSPAGRRVATEEGIDPSKVTGTGRDGRVTKEDLVNHGKQDSAPAAAAAPAKAAVAPTPGERPEERVPMTRIRARIAERLMQAKNSTAMLTSFNEVNLAEVSKLRKSLGEQFQKEYGVKLGFMSFFVKAAAEALKRYPVINASVDGSDVVYHGYQDISIAVSTDKGLVTPVLRDTQNLSFAEIEQGIVNYAKKAREGKLGLDDLQGGTFTITNGGTFGSLLSTPIINPPQSAILGMHTIKERPVVENGQIVAAPMMYLALSYDHRIIDGRDAVLFLVDIKNQLENPQRMLLGL